VQGADELIAGHDRAVVGEALLAVDDPGEVDTGLGVCDVLRFALLRDDIRVKVEDDIRRMVAELDR